MIPAIAALLLAAIPLPAVSGAEYREAIEKWRKQRETGLRADDGWLTVTGLFWLREGENRCGSQDGSEIELPKDRAPLRVGVFAFRNGRVEFRPIKGTPVRVNGVEPSGPVEMKSDRTGNPTMVTLGAMTMFVIQRGPRFAIRLKDLESEYRKEFHGLDWFPVDESYRVQAKFTSYDKPQAIPIPNILGQTENEASPGFAVFRLKGQEYKLYPVLEGDRLFFIFRDQTSGKTTYGAGRFLYTAMPKDGEVTLDFNQAYNPPCAFTPYATCPLPPRQNRLQVAIEAGEKKYGDH